MRRTDGVIARFLQDTDAPALGLRIGAGAEDAVVMVDAGSAKHHTFSIQRKSRLRVPPERPDAEALFCQVIFKPCTHGIKFRIFRAPGFRVRQLQLKRSFSLGGPDHTFAVQDLDSDLSGFGCFYRNADAGRVDGKRGHT